MFKFSFFHTPKPRQFNYRPRYYDPEAEEREQRKKELLGEDYADAYKTPEERAQSQREYHPGQYVNEVRIRRGVIADRRRQAGKRSARNRQLLISVALVAALLYYIFLT
ncbi:MAG: hypothetical protein LBU80_01405 [Rikenellaceae bacterium]|jgi:hypothetical protein|nr:hypothetical protein [Rikenellaceae bacterium]